MWIFSIYGFYSVAAGEKNQLMVRSRMRQHLEALQRRFPKQLGNGKIVESRTNDYKFRLVVGRKAWESVVVELAKEQTWSNFKGQVAKNKDHMASGYEDALHRVWAIMHGLQYQPPQPPRPTNRVIYPGYDVFGQPELDGADDLRR